MKRIISIMTIAVTVFSVAVSAAFPHHHHNDVVCMVMERCGLDNAYNDEHTGHSGDGQERTCPVSANYIASMSSESQTESISDGLDPLFISILCCIDGIRQYLAEDDSVPVYDGYRINYTSATLGENGGLRAPPCSLL